MANMNLTKDFAQYSNALIDGLDAVLDHKEFTPEQAATLILIASKLPLESMLAQAKQTMRDYGQTVNVDGFGFVTVDGKENAVVVWSEFKKAFDKEDVQTIEKYAQDNFDPSYAFIRKALGKDRCKELGLKTAPSGFEKHKNAKGEDIAFMARKPVAPSVEAHPY